MLIAGASGQGAGRTNDEGDHGCAVTTSGLEPLNELLDLPYLDLRASVSIGAQHNTRTSRAVQRAWSGGGRWGGMDRRSSRLPMDSLILANAS